MTVETLPRDWGWAAPELLQDLELTRHFEVLSSSARMGYQKPHPAIFEHALELLGVPPDKAILVGDDAAAGPGGRASRPHQAGPHRSPRSPPRGCRERRAAHPRPGRPARPAGHRATGSAGTGEVARLASRTGGERWRLFIAIPLAETVRRKLATGLEPYRRAHDTVRWQAPEAWHPTLVFLGSVDADQVPALETMLAYITGTR